MSTVVEKNSLLLNFEDKFEQSVFGTEIDLRRKNSFQKFTQQGFPTKKFEEYKYLPIEKLLTNTLVFGEQIAMDTNFKIENSFETSFDLSIVNGNVLLQKEIDTDQLYISTIANAIKKHPELVKKYYLQATSQLDDSFALLNDAFSNKGVFIYIKKSAVIEKPIYLHHFIDASSVFLNQRSLVLVEENAVCTIYESFISTNAVASVYNTVSEIFVNQNANFQYIKLEQCNKNLILINNQELIQEKKSVATNFAITINGGLTRNNTNVRLNSEHIESHLHGVYVANNDSIIDNHTLVDHRFPNCNSNELYKGIANDKAITVFNGKIFVRKDAQKTNAFQSNKNILMSDDATVNTKPQLEIYADDVKCSHGTSTGKLDENALFYLKARGIGEQSAKKLLLQAFVNDCCNPILQEDIKEYILNELHASIV